MTRSMAGVIRGHQAIVLVLAVVATAEVRRGSANGEPNLQLSGEVVNAPNEKSQLEDIPSDKYYRVIRDHLTSIPLVVAIGLSVSEYDRPVPLTKGGSRWIKHVSLNVERDGLREEGYSLELLYERVLDKDAPDFQRGDWSEGRQGADYLAPRETLRALCAVAHESDPVLPLGQYRIKIHVDEHADAFFGLPVRCFSEWALCVAAPSPQENADRNTEDLIQQHYLWAMTLYKFDRDASKRHFHEAWRLVRDYLKRGSGDQAESWNITPRWQASLIARSLDRPQEEIGYLSELLSGHEKQLGKGGQCKMRYYHFGRDVGALPVNIKDDLGRKVNRLYESFYGKTMNGRSIEPLRPWPKKFEDSPDPTLKLEELLPKNPE